MPAQTISESTNEPRTSNILVEKPQRVPPKRQAPPPFDPKLKNQHMLYGWKIVDFIVQHFEEDDVDPDEVADEVGRLAGEVGLEGFVHVFRNFIWLSRNYFSLRSGVTHSTGLTSIPDDEGIEKLKDIFMLESPEWHLLTEWA